MELSAATTVVPARDDLFTTDEQVALGGFLAGYRGLTREAYALDFRQYVTWCTEHAVPLFGARRSDMSASPATSSRSAEPERRSLAGCAPSPASTDTPKKRV